MRFVRYAAAFLILLLAGVYALLVDANLALVLSGILLFLCLTSLFGPKELARIRSKVFASLALIFIALPIALTSSFISLANAPVQKNVAQVRTSSSNPAPQKSASNQTSASRSPARCGTSLNTQAHIYAQQFVELRLSAPRTAKFPSIHRQGVHVTSLGNCEYLVQAYVDAQNGFGAMVRTPYAIQIKRLTHSDSWQLIDLRFGS